MTQPDAIAAATSLARSFERFQVRYVLGGSMASTSYGEPRSTLDADFAADLNLSHFEAWADERDLIFGLVDEAMQAGAKQDAAPALLEVPPRTLQRWRRQGTGEARRAGPRSRPSNKLTEAEEQIVMNLVSSPRFRGLSPKQIVPLLAREAGLRRLGGHRLPPATAKRAVGAPESHAPRHAPTAG